MPRPRRAAAQPKEVIAIAHRDDSRRNNPTAEMEAVMDNSQRQPIPAIYERRNRNLDPQLVWRGKDEQDLSDLVVAAPPLFTQEKVHPKALVDDLMRLSKQRKAKGEKVKQATLDLFADFNGLDDPNARTEFYEHDQHWSNRMILGDSLQVMASLAEREDLRGKVQCIYIDPPYGIRFNSNFQWSTTSRDVRDGNAAHITREPEQVKAFRDTWRDGIHSYLTYMRDRLTVARDLLADSGSIFVQIGVENNHRIRAVMDEVFGEANFASQIAFRKTTGKGAAYLDNTYDVVLWYAKDLGRAKYRNRYFRRLPSDDPNYRYARDQAGHVRPLSKDEMDRVDRIASEVKVAAANPMTSQSSSSTTLFEYVFEGRKFTPGKGGWKTNIRGMERLSKSSRLYGIGNTLRFIRPFSDFDVQSFNDIWDDTRQSGFGDEKNYVVQTATRVIQHCILMTTDPGDLVLDPTCGSGTTAYVAEQWGRRWITIDTSRVALALARARIMGARYPYYLLADSPGGQRKEAEIRRREISETPTHCNIRQGFVYERVPHITLREIVNNAEIDDIYENFQRRMEPIRAELNTLLETKWPEWEIPHDAEETWSDEAAELHQNWWKLRVERQKEIDASIAANADFEDLYDKPYEDSSKVRVAGPFTVESLSPHRILTSDDGDDGEAEPKQHPATATTATCPSATSPR